MKNKWNLTILIGFLLVGCRVTKLPISDTKAKKYTGYTIQSLSRTRNFPYSFGSNYVLFCEEWSDVEDYLGDSTRFLNSLHNGDLSKRIGEKFFELYSTERLNSYGYNIKFAVPSNKTPYVSNHPYIENIDSRLGPGTHEVFYVRQVEFYGRTANEVISNGRFYDARKYNLNQIMIYQSSTHIVLSSFHLIAF
jgi:hypothetical protein